MNGLWKPQPAREVEAIATAAPSSIGKPELRAFHYAKSVRGHHMALAMIAALSAAFSRGQENILWRLGPDPREGIEFDHPDGRIVLVAMPEFAAWSSQPMQSSGPRLATVSISRFLPDRPSDHA